MAQTKTKTKTKAKTPSKRSAESTRPPARSSGSTKKPANATIPLVAGGAVLAGVAGGMVLGSRQAHRHSRMDKAIKLAHELQQVRQSSNGGSKRSPVEVVLDGLTARRSRT